MGYSFGNTSRSTHKFLHLEWWVYLVAVITFFVMALILNYIVKKINESRLDERFTRLQNNINNRVILDYKQFEAKLPPKRLLEVVVEQSNPPTVRGISLVFNKDNLMEDRRIDQIDIRNFPIPKHQVTDYADLAADSKVDREKTNQVEYTKLDDDSKYPKENEVNTGLPSDCEKSADKETILQNQSAIENTSNLKRNIDNEQYPIVYATKIANALHSKSNLDTDNDIDPILLTNTNTENALDTKCNSNNYNRPTLQKVIKENMLAPKSNGNDDKGHLPNKSEIQNSSIAKNKDEVTKIPLLESMYTEISKIEHCKSLPLKSKGNTVDEKSMKTKGNKSIPNLKKLQPINQEGEIKMLSVDLEKNVQESISSSKCFVQDKVAHPYAIPRQ